MQMYSYTMNKRKMSYRENMCPLQDVKEVYKPVRVNNIIATFEQLVVTKSNQLARSETAVFRRNSNYKNYRRDIKSEHFAACDVKNDAGAENGEDFRLIRLNRVAGDGGGNESSSTSEGRRRRLDSLDELEAEESELVKTKVKAKAILKKYESEVLMGNDEKDLDESEQSNYTSGSLQDYSEILDNESVGSRSRYNSVSKSEHFDIEDEYVCVNAESEHANDEECEEDHYCRLKPPPEITYENVAILRKMVEDGNLNNRETPQTRTASVYRKELVHYNGTRTHVAEKKKYLIEELIHTEVRYINDLEFVIKNYMEYISSNYEGDPMRKYKFIFLNIEMITIESKLLLGDIRTNRDNYEVIGKIFCKNKPLMDRYIVYCKNKKVSEELINGQYAKIIEKRRTEIRDALGLLSYLLKPIQRLLRYEMFLKKLDKYLVQEGADTTHLKRAISMIQKTARTSNDLIVLSSIEQMPHSLMETGDFVLAESFKMLVPKKMEIQLFLFTKIVIFAAIKTADTFVYKTYIPLENLAKTTDVYKTTLIFEDYYMKKKHKDPSIVLDALNMEKKNKWIELIDAILWQQFHKIKDDTKAAFGQ